MRKSITCFLFWTILSFHGVTSLEDYPKVKVCEGLPNPLTGSNTHPQLFLNLTYANCTHITYHLIINGLKEHHDVSFLESIEEVGGSVIIQDNKFSRLSLPKLKVIRGKYLFKYHKRRPAASLLFVDNFGPSNQAAVLDLRSLRSVISGSIVVEFNTNLCFFNRVDWNALSEEKNPVLQIAKNSCNASSSQCSKECPVQNKARHCWGPDRSECQQLGPPCGHCSSSAKSRCFVRDKGIPECCSDLCAGGCHNRTASACVSCKDVINGKECLKFCPPEYVTDQFERKENPAFKRTLGSFCVKRCPKNFYMAGTICVKVCNRGFYGNENRTCVPCPNNDPTCKGNCHIEDLEQSLPPDQQLKHSRYTNRFLLQKIANCKTLQAKYIRINAEAVSTIAGKFRVREEDLQNLRNVIHITGCLHLDLSKFPGVTSLSFLSKLKSLSCTTSTSGLIVIGGKNLRFLDLSNLTDLRVSRAVFSKNPKLCYLDNFRKHFQPPYNKIFRAKSTPSAEACAKEGHKCDGACVEEFGCWGPGPRRCVRCKVLRAGNACVSRCEDEHGFFTETGKCRACHAECRQCRGPSEKDCVGRCRHVLNGNACVPDCPLKFFDDSGICRPCSTNCSVRTSTTRLCSGPKALPGPGGCNYCEYIEANKQLEIRRCLAKAPLSYFYSKTIPPKVRQRLKNFTDASSRLFIRCHPACLECTDSSPDTCDRCAKGYLQYKERQCFRECPPGSFQESPSRCQSCHRACRGGCNGTLASDCFVCTKRKLRLQNNTYWECVEKCPETQPHQIMNEETGEILCSAKSAGIMRSSISILTIFSIVPLVLLIGGGLCCFHQRRRRLSFMKERELLRARYTRRLEEEMEPLVSSNVAPNFGRIRVIGAKSLQKFGKLGVGAFGTVYRGRWIPEKEEGDVIEVKINVAIKELRTSTSADSQKFLAEAHVMASVNNPFCVHLLGVCLSSPMQLISEFVPLGNLTSYVPRHRQTLTSRILLTWALQIAKGMVYLESLGIVHRDLAARNVLLQRADLVRITDFGLAKLLDSGDELRSTGSERLPVAWLAIESLTELAFSHKSDVWAYGVTLWEIFTFCESQPYSHMRLRKLVDFLDSGERLEQPTSCTLDLYMLLLKCWVRDPSGRPTFEEIVEEVKVMASDPNRFLSTKVRLSVSKSTEKPSPDRPVSVSSSMADSQYENPISTQPAPVDEKLTAEEQILPVYLLPEPPHVRTCGGDGYLAVTSSPTT